MTFCSWADFQHAVRSLSQVSKKWHSDKVETIYFYLFVALKYKPPCKTACDLFHDILSSIAEMYSKSAIVMHAASILVADCTWHLRVLMKIKLRVGGLINFYVKWGNKYIQSMYVPPVYFCFLLENWYFHVLWCWCIEVLKNQRILMR